MTLAFKTVLINLPVVAVDTLFTTAWPEGWPSFAITGWNLGQTMGEQDRLELTFTFDGTAYRIGDYEGDDIIVDGTSATTTAYQLAEQAGLDADAAETFSEALYELHRTFVNAYRDASSEAKNVARDAALRAITSLVPKPQNA